MRITLILLSFLLAAPSVAEASSLAYIENGEVWLSSLDGAQKVRLAAPVVNANGATEKWLAVAASDGGRIVAARNEPGKTARLSWFKAWEPNGTSTVEGPLNALGGWALYAYPLSLDVTPDGHHMVYGYSNSGFCCPTSFAQGTYVRPVSNSPLDPISISGREWPTLFGSRVIARSGATISVQSAATTYGTDFEGLLDTSGIGLDLRRTDIAATGTLLAIELERWNGGTKEVGKIGVLSFAGVDQPVTFPAAVDCFLPAVGVAEDVSLSQDGRSIAWTDGQGLKVAGTPATADDPCALTSPPVVIAAAGDSASIGGADITAFLPPAAPPASPNPSTGNPPPAGVSPGSAMPGPGTPSLTLPAKVTAKALASGLGVKVIVGAAGKVTISGTVPAKTLGKKGKPVVVATGSATAKSPGQVTIKLKLNAAGRKKAKKLKGARLTLKIAQGGRTTTKTVKLR